MYKLQSRDIRDIMVVGCGGTGSMVASGLCRLLVGKQTKLILVDMDKVATRNLGRQEFYQEEVGKFKAKVLAERLSRQYGREIQYFTSPIEELSFNDRGDITIGCVDRNTARDRLQYGALSGSFKPQKKGYCAFDGWYIDAGNSEYSGQVLIGNALQKELHASFDPATGICSKLPVPSIQQPALLAPEARPKPPRDCAAAVQAAEQSPVINTVMAGIVLTFVHKLLTGTLTSIACYVDLISGTMNTVEAEPETVSRMAGLSVRQLEYHPRIPRNQ